jgi:hypothetical protein
MRAFIVILLGQTVSLFGSALSRFALGIWVYQTTGSVTQYVLATFFAVAPPVVLAPLLGSLVDRWEKRWAIILGNAGAGVAMLALALLMWSGKAELWPLYLAVAYNGVRHHGRDPDHSHGPQLRLGRRAGHGRHGRRGRLLAGRLLMAFWKGPEQRVRAILATLVLQGAALLLGGLRPDALLIATAAFLYLACVPVINACSQTIWQSKVPLSMQGRVFAIRQMVATSSLPLATLVVGPLADDVFEPLLAPGGALAASVGRLIGVGAGRGIALLLIVLGAGSCSPPPSRTAARRSATSNRSCRMPYPNQPEHAEIFQ